MFTPPLATAVAVCGLGMVRRRDAPPMTPTARVATSPIWIAVTTGLGGGSPRQVPRTISPEITYPATGQALYVFELQTRK